MPKTFTFALLGASATLLPACGGGGFLDRARRAPGAAPSLWLASSLAGLVPAAFRSCFKRRLW